MGQARTTVANGELKDHDVQPVLTKTLLSAKTLKEETDGPSCSAVCISVEESTGFLRPTRTALEGDWSVTTISELRRPAANAVVLSRDRP